MNIITFTYTKTDGKQSQRVLSPSICPSTMYEGVDISELDMDDQVMFVQEVSAARDEYLATLLEIQQEYDVKTMYRRFDPSKMSSIVKECI